MLHIAGYFEIMCQVNLQWMTLTIKEFLCRFGRASEYFRKCQTVLQKRLFFVLWLEFLSCRYWCMSRCLFTCTQTGIVSTWRCWCWAAWRHICSTSLLARTRTAAWPTRGSPLIDSCLRRTSLWLVGSSRHVFDSWLIVINLRDTYRLQHGLQLIVRV